MALRKARSPKPQMIDVEGVFGTFKVPGTNLSVEYVLTYATLDNAGTAHGQLLDLLVPVREALRLEELDFDHLLQRDLDDFRVSTEMVPYLLGRESSGQSARIAAGPRFFPPIVAVIVPVDGRTKVADKYPKCDLEPETEGELQYQHAKYGGVFSIKREVLEDGILAQSPVGLRLHPSRAKLIIVDGQHRAMAMLATYRSAMNRWNVNSIAEEFRYFYDQDVDLDPASLVQLQLPVCIAYFPELAEGNGKSGRETLTTACRKVFLDVNKEARPPSRSRTTLLDDTDIAALLTRHFFNMIQAAGDRAKFKLRHTEYDSPHAQAVPITRPFALTDVDNVFTVISHVCLADDELIRDPMKAASTARSPLNNKERLQLELKLEEKDEILKKVGIKVTDVGRYDYPKQAESLFREGFEEAWGKVILMTYSKFFPFMKHCEAVEAVLEEHEPYMGETLIAHTALVEGQGLRQALKKLHDRDKAARMRKGGGPQTKVEKAWQALEAIEEDFEQRRAKLYLKLRRSPTQEELDAVKRMFTCFRSSAFQNGLFMTFACLKDRMNLTNAQFISHAADWVERLNARFEKDQKVRIMLFDSRNPKSVRRVYNPRGGANVNPKDWPFFRYLMFELLSK